MWHICPHSKAVHHINKLWGNTTAKGLHNRGRGKPFNVCWWKRPGYWLKWCVLQATWPGGGSWWGLLQAAVSSLTVTGPGSHGDFDHPDISWEDYTARHAQSRRFLQKMDNNFLLQVVEEPTRKGALLDLVLTNNDWLRMWRLEVDLAAATTKWWSSGSCMDEAGR